MTQSLLFELIYAVLGGAVIVALLRWWRSDLSWILGASYLAATLVFFAPAFRAGGFQVETDLAYQWRPWREAVPERVIPRNPLLADPLLQMLPFRRLVRERLLHGEAPLWADELGTGQPLLGDAHTLSPLHLFALAAPPLQALTVTAVWQVLLALLLTHLLLRHLGASPAGAVLGAVAFAFSTFSVAWLYYPLSTTACWLPGTLLGLLLLRQGARGGAAAFVVCAWGMALSGHPETLAHAGLAVLAVAGCLFFASAAGRWQFLARFTAAVTLAGCLSAPVLLPVVESILGGERLALLAQNPAAVTQPSFELRGARLLVDPLAFGSPRDGNWSGPANFNETATAYGGLLVLALAAAGAGCVRGKVLAIVLGGLVALLVALNVPPFSLLLAPFLIFRHAANARMRFLWVLALAVAAGLSLDPLLRGSGSRRVTALCVGLASGLLLLFAPPGNAGWQQAWWLATLAGSALTLGALFAPGARRYLPAGVCGLVFLDLVLLGIRYNPAPDPALDLAPPAALRFMMGGARVVGPPVRVAAQEWDLLPNLAALYGLGDPRGNDPTRPARAARFVGERLAGAYVPGAQVRLPANWLDQGTLDYLGVRFLLTRHTRLLPPPWRLAFDGEGGRVWENPDALPLFFFPRRREATPDAGGALRRALDVPDFRALGIVEAAVSASSAQQGQVTSVTGGSGRYELAVSSPHGGLVVSSVSYTPGWTASTRHGPLQVRRANGAFLGFDAPPGAYDVFLRYDPLGWKLGLVLAAGGALAAALRFAFGRKKRIAPSSRSPLSLAHAQDDRTDHPLFRNAGSAHQHDEPGLLAEPGADVVGVVARLELHARPGPDGPDLRQPHPHARVCDQPALGRPGHARRPPRAHHQQGSSAGEEALVGLSS
jgi:hypothetical protein